ncbi:MAG TPA: hypothetical protein VGO40_00545 [Longimicrobium sp.]|jgi:hypothetical protein|nr:hypothetical protein [Longimicrobium sp.]
MSFVRILTYLLPAPVIHLFILENHLPEYLTLVLVFAVGACEYLATARPQVTAWLIANRVIVARMVMVLSVLASIPFLFVPISGRPPGITDLLQFALQGMVVGVIMRMLILAMFARLLKGASVEVYRGLLFLALTMFLLLFPMNSYHPRAYAASYLMGFGVGFMLHYVVRRREHKRAQEARYGRHIAELVAGTQAEDTQNADGIGPRAIVLQTTEARALKDYAEQRWRRLERSLEANRHPTTVLAIVKASLQRIKGRYAEARNTVDTELQRPGCRSDLKAFLYLHLALSLGDTDLKDDMHKALDKALETDPKCLLALVTKALRIAEDLPLVPEEPVEQDVVSRRGEILKLIWRAQGLHETTPPELVTTVVERAVPMTWTFLLDSYAYVLLKAGHHKFARVLFTQCIYEDPYFSSPYLHLGEWCIADLQKVKSASARGLKHGRARRSRRIGVLCLYIAIHLEKKRQSLTRRRAQEMLDTLEDLVMDPEGPI